MIIHIDGRDSVMEGGGEVGSIDSREGGLRVGGARGEKTKKRRKSETII